jgi:AcrR family transcriptional regulator
VLAVPSQERAERTRQRLVRAAATEFARHGYDATSLMRISKSAGVTMGALAFHFPSKIDLARAVYADGAAATRAAVVRVDRRDQNPLQAVIDIHHVLALVLVEDPTVRAAGRLSQEVTQVQGRWTDSWLPRVRQLLERAGRQHLLRPRAEPDLVTLLVRYVVSGIEMSARDGACPDHRRRLAAIWDMVLPSIADEPALLRTTGPTEL